MILGENMSFVLSDFVRFTELSRKKKMFVLSGKHGGKWKDRGDRKLESNSQVVLRRIGNK